MRITGIRVGDLMRHTVGQTLRGAERVTTMQGKEAPPHRQGEVRTDPDFDPLSVFLWDTTYFDDASRYFF